MGRSLASFRFIFLIWLSMNWVHPLDSHADLKETLKKFESSTQKMNSGSRGASCETPSPTPSPSPTPPEDPKVLVGLIFQSGMSGALLQDEKKLNWGLSDKKSKALGSFNASHENFMDRWNQANQGTQNSVPSDVYALQTAADLLLKGAGSFYGTTGDVKNDSKAAATWFSDQIGQLQKQGVASNPDQVQALISMMMDQMYSNYNDPLNPGSLGGDNLPRNIANMGAGYQQYIDNNGQASNDLGGVCDHIAAAGCQLWNKVYPDKPCFIVNIQSPGLQHWVTATQNADGTYSLMDAGSVRTLTAEGNPISDPGNPQLFVPIAKVNEAGDAIIVEAPPSELMNFMRHLSRPDTEEGQLFRGMSQAGFATYKIGKKADRPLVLSIGGGRGRLSNQNFGEEVWGVFANLDKTGKFIENKLTLFYSVVGGAPQGQFKVAGLDQTTSVFYAIPVVPNLTIDLRAGINIGAGVMIPEGKIEYPLYDIGYTGGGKFFAQTAISGQKKISPNTTLKGKVVFRGEGLPGLVITQMHGTDNGYGLKNGIQGFNGKIINQNQFQIIHTTKKGTHAAGIQGGVTYGPLNYDGKPDWNLGGNYSFDNGKVTGFRGIQSQVSYAQYRNFFNDGNVGKFSVGSTFATSRKNSKTITLITPSLYTQMVNYVGATQFYGGAGLIIQFDRKPAAK